MKHAYGPHNPTDDQRVVTIFDPRGDREQPVPTALLEQRRQINDLAHAP